VRGYAAFQDSHIGLLAYAVATEVGELVCVFVCVCVFVSKWVAEAANCTINNVYVKI
jgi:hypothetical protein